MCSKKKPQCPLPVSPVPGKATWRARGFWMEKKGKKGGEVQTRKLALLETFERLGKEIGETGTRE